MLHGKKEGRDNGMHPGSKDFFPEGYKYNYPSTVSEPYSCDLWMNYINIGKKSGRNNGLEPVCPFFNEGYLERYPERTVEQAWKDYVFNLLKSPDKDLNLYPAGTIVRDVLRRKNPSVAVIMPVYNCKNSVMDAIVSVQNQSWTNWHLYLIDDFSDDGTYEYLKSIISDSRILLLKSKNKGVCAARNTAIARMKSEDYTAYLEPDRTWNREYLELMLCRMLETKTSCCYGAVEMLKRGVDGSLKVTGFDYQPFDIHKLLDSDYIDLNVFIHSSGFFKEIGVFDSSLDNLGHIADWDMILRLAERHPFSRLPYVACTRDDAEEQISVTGRTKISNYENVVRNRHCFEWDYLSKNLAGHDDSLVTVIIYYNKNGTISFLRNCLNSLKKFRLYGHSKYLTEIILVDDTCSEEAHSAVSEYYDSSMIDNYIVNDTECGFSLSCNKAISLANGSFCVFLDSKSYVSVNWLDALINPLKRHTKLKGTSAKVLLPDGVINSAGCLLDSGSGFPYDILHGLPSDFPAAKKISLIPCVNGYCCAFRISDLIARKGMNCRYDSFLAISDLCMQIGDGQAYFAYIPSAIVLCPCDGHGMTEHMGDLESFSEVWSGKKVADEQKFFLRRGLNRIIKSRTKVCSVSFKKYTRTAITLCSADYLIPVYDYTKLGYGCEIGIGLQTILQNIKSLVSLVVIKSPEPAKPYYKKYDWGDYYFAKSLERSFRKLGFDTRIDHRDDWYSHKDGFCINIVLRGLRKFDCSRCPNALNIMWLIYYPDKIDYSEFNGFDCILAASEILTEKYSRDKSIHVPCTYLPQCTDTSIFSPAASLEAYSSGNLFLGNSRGIFRDVVRKCIDEGVGIEIIGNEWTKYVGRKFIRSGAVPNFLVPFLYRSAETVLNDHREDMIHDGIVSNRIFDVLACGKGIVTDNFHNIPEELQFACFSYEKEGIKKAIERCRIFNHGISQQQKRKLRNVICDEHSFDKRALQISEAVYQALARRTSGA